MPGIADLFAASAPQAQPVQNVPTQMNQLANEQALNQQRQAMTASSAQDIQLKQRGMQASMLAAGMDKPEILPQLVRSANKLGGVQLDENMTPDQARAFVMSSVPVEQQPQYGLMQQQAGMVKALRDRLARGGPQAQPMPSQASGSTPPPAPNNLSGGSGSLIDPDTMALMAVVNPPMATALSTVQKTQQESPGGKAQAEYQTKSAGKLADLDATENLLKTSINQMQTALEPDNDLDGKSAAETAIGGFAPEDRSMYSMQFPNAPFANQKGGLAYSKLQTLLNPEAGEEAKASFNRVTGQEFKTFQASQGLNVPPDQRPKIIKTAIAQAQKKLADIQSQRGQLVNQAGVSAPQSVEADFNAKKGSNPQPPSMNAGEQAQSIMAAKQAIANGAPKDAVRKRLMDAGINPTQAGL